MVTKIITRRIISSVKISSAAEDSNRDDDVDNNKRNNTQGDNFNDDDKYHRNEGEENQLAKKLKGCQNKAADGGMICDNGHSYHDVFFRCKPNDDTTAEDDGKAAAFRQHTTVTTCKKLPLLLDDADDDEAAKCQKGKQMCIDLTDVPLKLPTKNNKKGASSKYQGVYFDYSRNKWRAHITIDEKIRHIGYYDNEEEAAVDYARALFKYGSRRKRKFTFTEMSAQDREEVSHKRKATMDDEGKAADLLGNNADASKERPIVLGGADDTEKKKPWQKKEKLIDLTDVPPQLPIKNNKKGASSKYQGVYFDYSRNKWMAKSMIDGKQHHIGNHENEEEEAAVDYARALFEYEAGKVNARGNIGQKFVDLTDVPPQLPIIGNMKGASSKYQGVCFVKRRNKWKATISLDGRKCFIAEHANEEEAAVDYARALFKYGSRRKRQFIDLTDVPSQPPILNNHDRYETSKYQGVHFKTAGNKWNAAISLNGKLYGIGTYDTEEEAAVDFARAKFKYVQNSSTMVESHTDKESNGET